MKNSVALIKCVLDAFLHLKLLVAHFNLICFLKTEPRITSELIITTKYKHILV